MQTQHLDWVQLLMSVGSNDLEFSTDPFIDHLGIPKVGHALTAVAGSPVLGQLRIAYVEGRADDGPFYYVVDQLKHPVLSEAIVTSEYEARTMILDRLHRHVSGTAGGLPASEAIG